MPDFQYKVSNALSSDAGLPGLVSKLDIGVDSIYVKTSWMGGNIVNLDITLSRGSKESTPVTADSNGLDMQLFDLARCSVEDSCRQASRLLELGADIHEIVSMWRGVHGFPSGVCPKLQSVVSGPLHAAAVLIDSRFEDWKLKYSVPN
jgi:hypothetical protein